MPVTAAALGFEDDASNIESSEIKKAKLFSNK